MASGPDPDLTIVLLGNTGVGKSASGNTILGRPAFESKRSLGSVTKQISEVCETVFGKRITLVDTPGILGSESRIQTKCEELLKSSRPCLFLLVIKLDRFTTEQKNAAEAVERILGDQGLRNCFLLFTGEDMLESTLKSFLYDDPDGPLIPLVKRFNRRVHMFNNVNGGQQQVRKLLKKSGHLQRDGPPTAVRRIVLLGLPGGGKSSTGNTILGSKRFRSAAGFISVTEETVSESAIVEGQRVKVVDTPGITAEGMDPKELFYEIMKSVKEAAPGPHAFIIVVKIDRISEVHVNMFEILDKLFGKDSAKYAMVLFTHGDQLTGQSIGDVIKTDIHVRNLVSRCGDRYCVFDNTKGANRVQVRNLLGKIDKMVMANNAEHYTVKMFRDIQGFQLNISLKWDELKEWFINIIRIIYEKFKRMRSGSVQCRMVNSTGPVAV